MSERPVCDYYGCPDPQEPEQPSRGMRFCERHGREFDAMANGADDHEVARRLLRFWVQAQGGAGRAARRIMFKNRRASD